MKNPIHLGILLSLALVVWGPVSSATAQTCMGFTCTIIGTPGPDVLIGTPGVDVICGLAGNDQIFGRGDGDKICGGLGADDIHGDVGPDLIDGGDGADTIDGGGESDTAAFAVAITADLSTGSTSEGDVLTSIENLSGSQGPDTLIGDSGNNALRGMNGDDLLIGNGGNDMLIGGGGVDTAQYDAAINANLATGTASDGDSLSGIENLTGSDFGDVLTGDGNANVLLGRGGVDTLDGGAGTDNCDGGLPFGRLGFEDPDFCSNCETAVGCSP